MPLFGTTQDQCASELVTIKKCARTPIHDLNCTVPASIRKFQLLQRYPQTKMITIKHKLEDIMNPQIYKSKYPRG